MTDELTLKTKRGRIDLAWVGEDLEIDAENSDERVCLYLTAAQVQELLEFLRVKAGLRQ
jgi:hypothetical protein